MEVEPNVEVMFCKEADMFLPVDKGPDNGYHQRYRFVQSKIPIPSRGRKTLRNGTGWYRLKTSRSGIGTASPPPNRNGRTFLGYRGDVATRNNRYWRDHGVQYVYNDQIRWMFSMRTMPAIRFVPAVACCRAELVGQGSDRLGYPDGGLPEAVRRSGRSDVHVLQQSGGYRRAQHGLFDCLASPLPCELYTPGGGQAGGYPP